MILENSSRQNPGSDAFLMKESATTVPAFLSLDLFNRFAMRAITPTASEATQQLSQ
jgi:hypothetical protein